MPSHSHFDYFFSDIEGITFGWEGAAYNYDLVIFYGTDLNTSFIDCRCSRWDVQDYSVIVSTWVSKQDAQNLRSNIRPGAVGEQYKLYERPVYKDKTWSDKNTLRLYPTPSSNAMPNSRLKSMREETLIIVKNLVEHPITNTNWIEIKIEGYVSGNKAL